MILDTSVIIAVLRREPDRRAFLRAIYASEWRRLSAASYVEAAIVSDRSPDPFVRSSLDDLLRRLAVVIEPVSVAQARLAREAHQIFGRGSGHPAALNYGDCFAYALSKEMGEPLLFKGDDFNKTDIPFVGRREERRRLSEILAAYGA